MNEKVTCISLRAVAYSDTGVMLTVWTRELGLLSVAVSLGASREARRRRALMLPPMAFEAVAHRKTPSSDVARLSDVRALPGFSSLTLSPMRTVVATFLAECLSLLLRNSTPDRLLSDFIFTSWLKLATAGNRALANFHIAFLTKLLRFLGIEPDFSTFRKGYCFDMRDAVFCPAMPVHGHGLDPQRARLAALFLRLDMDGIARLPLSREIRNLSVDTILDYLTVHHTPLSSLRSLSILREICN